MKTRTERNVKCLIVGKSARVDVIATQLKASEREIELNAFSEVNNPGLLKRCKRVQLGITDDLPSVRRFASAVQPDFAIIGPEEPLAAGIVDMLRDDLNIQCIGPTKSLARIESSKSFTRELLRKHNIIGNPEFTVVREAYELEKALQKYDGFVIKPDGLTGGKGVKVQGEHFETHAEAYEYCREIIAEQPVVIEEKLVGEEFSLQSFCDGRSIVHMVPVQDHKRAFEGDRGPNTGGMGSYSCADHSLPFLDHEIHEEAKRINEATVQALQEEVGEPYKGILYGGFMVTRDGLRLIEYNARFGDPEVMNTMAVLSTDFLEICEAIVHGNLDTLTVTSKKKATVCKYVVPDWYPGAAKKASVDISKVPEESENRRMYFGAVNYDGEEYILTGSRAIAFVGIGDDLEMAQRIAEEAANSVTGPVRHRSDIGTAELIEKRIEHMKKLKSQAIYAS